MQRPNKSHTAPTNCAKCGSERIKREELSMHGKWGFMGRGYRFNVYICQDCGYSELFFQKASWL